MRLSYIIAVALIAGSGLGSASSAKSLAEGALPVNFPPADYAGRSFVDNDGCVYLRAGVDGNVQWVPRVTRSRQVICGQTPTFGARQVATAPAVSAPVIAPKPVAAAPVAAPKPAPRAATPAPTRVVRQVAPKPAQPKVVRRVASAPVLAAPVVTISPPQPTTPKAKRVVVQTPGVCESKRNGHAVRCGPQSQSPTWTTRSVASAENWTGGHPAPGHKVIKAAPHKPVAQKSSILVPVSPGIPYGYRQVWDDGRLNPLRGVPQKVATKGSVVPTKGYDLAWTSKAPHLLFDRKTGLVVGHEIPGLVYPNTDPSKIVVAAPKPVTHAPKAGSHAPLVVISTKSPVPKATHRAPTPTRMTHRHIQVATYGSMAAARAEAQQLANTGLRTRIGTYRSGGSKRQVIVLGPFASPAALNAALSQARGMGFYGATPIK
ncbi:MAG: SPOR domain-containing protein [Pseudomonadota bacterium]